MSNLKDQTTSFSVLDDLVRQQKNNELKSIVETSEPLQLIENCGTTLLHLAAKYNNIDLIKILLELGYDSNLKNVSGKTPILMAAINSHMGALNLLLDTNLDWEVVLQSIIAENSQVPENVIGGILKHLRKKVTNAAEAAEILIKSGCPLDLVLLMKDADTTKEILSRIESVSTKEFCRLVRCAMKSADTDNVKVILERKMCYDDYFTVIKAYIRIICQMINDGDSNSAKLLLKCMADWNLYKNNIWLAVELIDVFEKKNKKVVQAFLDCGVNEHVKKAFGFDLVAHLIVNRNFEAREVLHDREFDANALGDGKYSALYRATVYGTVGNLEFLLERGANPNMTNQYGISPVFYVVSCAERAIQLLRRGADVQIITKKGCTMFDDLDPTTSPVLAHLAMEEAKGVSVKPEIREKIDSNELKSSYAKCSREIEWMRKQTITRNVTLFTALVENERKLSSFIQSQATVIVFLSRCVKRDIHNYYYETLQVKLNNALTMNNLKCKAAEIISECMGVVEPDHLVIDLIISFLTLKDLRKFA